MKKVLRAILGIKTSNPEAEAIKKEINDAMTKAYKEKQIEYAKTLGEEKAKFEFENSKKRFQMKEKANNWFMDWLMKGEAK